MRRSGKVWEKPEAQATMLDMLPPDEAEAVVKIMKRMKKEERDQNTSHETNTASYSYAFDHDKILEPAYKDPSVRRWHRRYDDHRGKELFRQVIAPLVAAGRDDLTTFAKALSSGDLGLSPGSYSWAKHDGVYKSGTESIEVWDGFEEYWGDTIGETKPEKILPKALGVTSPEQINARLFGTSLPVLQPVLEQVAIEPGRIRVTADISHGEGFGFVTRCFDFDGDKRLPPHIGMENIVLPDSKIGHGYGLAIHASNNAWARDIGIDTSIIGVAMDAGSYVWPLIGYNNEDGVPTALQALHETLTEHGQNIGVSDLREKYNLDSLPKIARHPLGKEALLKYSFIDLRQPTHGSPWFKEIAELRAQDIREGKR